MDERKSIEANGAGFSSPQVGDHPFSYIGLIRKAADYIKLFMKEHHNPDLYYHNLAHTERVVAAATEIGRHYGLGNKEQFIVLTAAWFHDIGYYEDPENHEQAGAARAELFLKGLGAGSEEISAITAAIMATKVPQSPSNQLERIVCDADLYHFGTDEFSELNKQLHREMEAVHRIEISKEEWLESSIQLLANHHYHTTYCKELLKKKKKANLEKLEEKFRKLIKTVNPIDELVQQQKEEKKTSADPYDVTDKPERGIETLFRIASGISQRLNEQADNKAHILISVNAIIISVFLTLIVRRLEVNSYLIFPVSTLLASNLITIIFSIIATRPGTSGNAGNYSEESNDKINLLFFGNFYHMSFDEYAQRMFHVIRNEHLLYSSLIRNLYDQGIVLGRKYRMLKVAYNVFMYGLIVSVIAFVVASSYFGAS